MNTLKKQRYFLRWLSFCAVLFVSHLSHAEDCNELIRLGLYNVYNSVDQHDSLVTAYHHFCDQRYDSSSSSQQGAMNVSFNYLKVGLGLGGGFGSALSQTSWSSICEDTATLNKLNIYNSLNSQTIYQGSLDAWQSCLAMQARGLKTDIRPTSTFTGVTFDLYWTGSSSAKFRGIAQPDLGKAICNVTTDVAGKIVTQIVKPDTQFSLTTKASSFVCNRLLTTLADGTKTSEAMRLTIKTSDGSFDIDLPPLGLQRLSIADVKNLYARMDTAEKGATLPGSIVAFSGAVIPNNWLEANGAVVSRATYATLFAVIGTRYGAGDGVSTFKLPDLRGQFIRGWDHGRGLDPDGNRVLGSAQVDDFKSHTHTFEKPNGYGGSGGGSSGTPFMVQGLFSTSPTGGTETRPKNVALMYLIKY